MPDVLPEDFAALLRDKYDGTADPVALIADMERLAAGEPLAYIIGWQPFLGLRVGLSSRPLIPRPETEYWTELLVAYLQERFDGRSFRFLDLCAGSGAIGLAVLARCPDALVSFGELEPAHARGIEDSIRANGLDGRRADVRAGDLFAPFGTGEAAARFDVIAANPPYVPAGRELPESVAAFEPRIALFSGGDGLDLIRRIAAEAPQHLTPGGELWLEGDVSTIEAVPGLLAAQGAEGAVVHRDHYGRPRYVVAHW